jgi:hypothetical protein
MTDYRYLFCDLLTRQVVHELPLSGVSFGRRLNKPGNATFSWALGDPAYDDQAVIDYVAPGRTSLFIERNGSLIWGGIIWSRTWNEAGEIFTYTCQTFESFFYRQFIESHLNYVAIDQRNMLIDLVITMQSKLGANIGIITPDRFLNSTPRTENFWSYEGWTFGKAIEFLVNYDDGFDYTLEVNYDVNGDPAIFLRVDEVLGMPLESTQLEFDYPGSIKTFYYPENASTGAVSVLGFGAGDGVTIVRSKVTDYTLLAAGYPDLQNSYDNKDVSVQGTLDSQTQETLDTTRVPVVLPTFELDAQAQPELGSWSLGDQCLINIDGSKRFPEGKVLTQRIIGYDAAPNSSEGLEEVKIILDGGDLT